MNRKDILDSYLQYLDMSTMEKVGPRHVRVPTSQFKEAEIIDENFSLIKDRIILSAKPTDLEKNFDVSSITRMSNPNGFMFNLNRLRAVDPKEVRGCTKQILPIMAEHTFCGIKNDTHSVSLKMIYGYHNSAWKIIDSRLKPTSMNPPFPFEILCGLHFAKRYAWRAIIETMKKSSISFQTNAEGSMALFKLRDVPEGKKRRASLKNWVEDHWRAKPSSLEEETKVRRHLRGAVDFKWSEMNVKIIPSDYDLELNQKIKQEAL